MNDLADLLYFGLGAIIPAILFLLAAAGRRKLAVGLALILGITLLGTIVGTVAGFYIGDATEKSSGEFRGLAVLLVATMIGAGCLVVFLIGSIWWVVRTGRIGLEKSLRSAPLLIAGCACVVVALGSLALITINSTPSLMSNNQLMKRVCLYGRDLDSAERMELVKRGQAAVPAIIAELHRHPYKKTREDEVIDLSAVNPLLNVLGTIGGPDATSEVKHWSAQDVPTEQRVVALRVLAEAGDRSVLLAVIDLLAKTDAPDWPIRRTDLLSALAALKSSEHIGLIRTALIGEPAKKEGYLSFDTVLAGVSALVAIDNDDSWAVLKELVETTETSIRTDSIRALEHSPSKRSIPLLAKALDDPDTQLQQAAFEALLHIDPNLLGANATATYWNDDNVLRLRAVLKTRAETKP